MRRELAKHDIVIPSLKEEPEEESVNAEDLEEKGEQEGQVSEKKTEEEIKVSLLDSDSG